MPDNQAACCIRQGTTPALPLLPVAVIMSLGSVTIRSPQRFPEHLDGSDTISISPLHQVEFKHPAYPAGFDTFLKLPAFDHPDGGLHYNTAKVACGIIAGNRWDGSFRTGTDEHDLHFEDDDIMPLGVYYFLLPGFRYGMSGKSKWYAIIELRWILIPLHRFGGYILPNHPQLYGMDIPA